ncbi:MAG: hypothetical protein MJ192_03095 [Clostridia bacterium]|nr:hypothetical protein [Clostridia bacterium]
MSIKKNSRPVHTSYSRTHTYMEEVTVYTTTRSEALALDTEYFVQGSILFVIREAKMYMLDTDGGSWYNVANGLKLEEDV